ncbi:MAG: leucine-rich repeat domain-containing protein [Tannerella sp.]|nr:leucine-rich repeat domain-containing protein [Tannerella sp.]
MKRILFVLSMIICTACIFVSCSDKNEIDMFSDEADFQVINGVLVKYRGLGGEVRIPDKLNIMEIGYRAFYYERDVKYIVIPESVKRISNDAFYNCAGLDSITLSGGVTSIGSSAFSGCSSLDYITLPDRLTSIGSSAFSGCSSLTSVVIPEGIDSIKYGLFSRCSSLKSVTIPQSVKVFDYAPFYSCSSLVSIKVKWQTPISMFSMPVDYDRVSNVTLKVPRGTKEKYMAANVWQDFGKIEEED